MEIVITRNEIGPDDEASHLVEAQMEFTKADMEAILNFYKHKSDEEAAEAMVTSSLEISMGILILQQK
jgi:hypothetical protein